MLTSSKLGKAIGLSKATVIRLAKDGRIPSIILPFAHRRFDVGEVKAALSADPFAATLLAQEGGQK